MESVKVSGATSPELKEVASSSSSPQLEEVSDSVDAAITDATKAAKKKKKKSAGAKQDVAAITDGLQTVNIAELSQAELYRYIQSEEQRKQKEKAERYALKQAGTLVPKEHKFWDTQPVPKVQEEVTEFGPIDSNTDVALVKQEPYNMPQGFEWCDVDVLDPAQIQEIYTLLTENYVEDDECHFRFDYSVPFLQWALTPPGYLRQWHLGVRNMKTGALMGCITAVPCEMKIYEEIKEVVEINFLCVHKKLRTKRLAPVLIKEITRRVNLQGRWQAAYTAGIVLPKPVGRCRYWHRSLNPKKLIEVKFSHLPQKTTLVKHLKDLKLPDRPAHELRPMRPEDTPAVHAVLMASLLSRKLTQVFGVEELGHILLPRPGVVATFVLENEAGAITDLCSYYHLPSTIIGNETHKKLNAVYSYYNVANTMAFEDLIRDALVLARNEGADVFNALDLGENGPVLEPLKFGQGDGFLQYYLYNWKCPQMAAPDIGLVLL